MFIKSVNIGFIKRFFLFLFIIFLAVLIVVFTFVNRFSFKEESNLENIFNSDFNGEEFMNQISNISTEEIAEDAEKDEDSYIKWVDFKGTASVLNTLANLDIFSHNDENSPIKYNWIELMAYLGCKYGGDLSLFKQSDLDNLVASLNEGKSIEDLSSGMKLYNYFFQSYDAIFHEYIGEYEIQTTDENGNKVYTKKYGLKAFLPIAKNYSFNHYKDFGTSRSYGYRRVHLGNDLMGSIGTPIIAVESGYVEALGWNQYGGWRIGIRSFDGKRYYYYAHLRKDHPYAKDLTEGDIVQAGDVFCYL